MSVTQEDVDKAITIVETSRATHVDWKAWQERTPDWREWVKREPESPGTPEHHAEVIAEYDHVLKVLRALAPTGDLDTPAPWEKMDTGVLR